MPRSRKDTRAQRRPATRCHRHLNDTLDDVDVDLDTPITAVESRFTTALVATPAAAFSMPSSTGDWASAVSTSVESSPFLPPSSPPSPVTTDTSSSAVSSAVEASASVDVESDPDIGAPLAASSALLRQFNGAPEQQWSTLTAIGIRGALALASGQRFVAASIAAWRIEASVSSSLGRTCTSTSYPTRVKWDQLTVLLAGTSMSRWSSELTSSR
ncbi:hypothetical protein PR003_g5360 [Phytophthora rubi]|uniref:Uncharacterized protein n=1 Tax=Phytophthora rubi TaxID=129364 RepID=A0A6A3NC36_9STRA|nr:hypothetical protein PR002_g5424 [Phytophthora rubi]KAE9045016.1 hypothetical protein PR001_g5140 [Phytophthora rubi]KAE9350458.1 hypothetical protein PR003_g5360 [Phytophthora rubi]